MKVAATGHRIEKFEGSAFALSNTLTWLDLMADFLASDERFGLDEGISGMATGVDQLWATVVLEKKIPLSAYVPYWGQARKWSSENRDNWSAILGLARDVKVFGRSEPYDVSTIWDRNRGMVDDCDLLLVVKDGSDTGGTAGTLRYAQEVGRSWVSYNPWDNSVNGSDDVKAVFGVQ